MRVAIITEVFLPKIDGVVNRTLNLIRHLPEYGDELLVVCPSAAGCTACPVPVFEIPSFSFPPYPEYRIGKPDERLVERLSAFRPDVVHYVNPFAFGFRCHDVLLNAGMRIPSVFSFHTVYGDFAKQYKGISALSSLLWWVIRAYHNQADVNLTVSTTTQQELIQRKFHNVQLWPPAVNTDLYQPDRKSEAMRQRLSGGESDKPLLLTVSRLAPEKNVGFLADVMRRLDGAATLAIVGDGPQRADLEKQFAGADARFIGYLKGEELAAAYASADAFVYASETETMGNVVLEAMACGCPVVAPRAGGIPSLISHGRTGFLYTPRNLEDAVSCTQELIRNSDLHQRIRQNGLAAVQGRGWAPSVGQVRRAYIEAVQAARRDATPTLQQGLARATLVSLIGVFEAMSQIAGAREQQAEPSTAL